MNTKFSKWDILPIVAVLALAVAVFLLFLPSGDRGAYVEIYQKGQLIATLPLDTDTTYTVTGAYENTVTVDNGRVAVTHSDCPGGDCQKTGWSNSPGKAIVCLPNALEIRVVAQSDVDIVVR